jgi:hypothetical protein
MIMDELKDIDLTKVSNFNFKIPHRNWKKAFAEAFVLMTTAMPGEVISIVGPTRAGKTELLSELGNVVCGAVNGQGDDQPIVAIELVNDDAHARFTFRSFILQALEVVRHPLYSSYVADGWGNATNNSRIERAREKTLNRALIHALIQRKTRFLIIDEAQHIRYVSKETLAAVGVMDALKAMAKVANVVLVVAGTYPILDAMNRSSHLEGRKYDIHLSRYHQTEEDMDEFRWILANYSSVMDLDKSLPSLMDCTELLYQGTFGCIGLVRAWLYHASVLAATRQQKVSLTHIKESMKSPMQLYSIADEILDGETILGLQVCTALKSTLEANSSKNARKKGKPFQRNPKRFEVENRI